MSKLIAIDAGHEYNTAGKRTPKFDNGDFMHEWEFNYAVAIELEKILKRCGFRTLNVNPDKSETSLAQRVSKANTAGADFYISIHANALTGKWGNAKGIETFVWPSKNGSSEKIGRLIHKHLMTGTNMVDRGVKDGSWLYVIKHTKMPSVLVECGFMDNLREAKLLMSSSYRQECAVEIAKGICEGFGVKYVSEPVNKETPKPAPSPKKESNKGVKIICSALWTYNSKDWNDKAVIVHKDEVFTIISDKIKVDGGYMYQIKSGLYITASSKYVQVVNL
ncbi:N-acetylmuramoyl-L-alanine amidase [Cytobacillus sp. NCCP-133]|uniref:N-acetylmuramoyl-L-alanine amidase n=1 Tax=Cytobacillus sp. NCCP-133 TaxID=766848 RepID=UPI0022309C73|nr:N-acetylmuramoyl-L-alanine amidase [Cytobacillus sp. NCCP-133]GLB58684.1 hypothetical protein NCCP133_08170 [Cytobacillus sp. NCCP-133]